MKKHYLSICCIVKNESLYVEEFIEFHILQGVEHFIIYEHESNDDTYKILKRYESLGLVTLNKIYGPAPQARAYTDCLSKYGEESQWVAFLDCDEFLHVTQDQYKVLVDQINSPEGQKATLLKMQHLPIRADGFKVLTRYCLLETLKTFEAAGAVAVNWIFYGSNGEHRYKEGLVIERFPMRCKAVDMHVKSIVQPHLTIGVGNNAHYFKLKTPAVNERREPQPAEYYWSEKPTANIFRINHYHTKSKEEYYKRKSLPLDVDGVKRTAEVGFPIHDINEMHEPFPEKLVIDIKYAILGRRNEFYNNLWTTKLEGRAWQVKEEFLNLLMYADVTGVKKVLEIGTHKGGSALGFLELGMDVVSVDIVKQPEVEELERLYPDRFTFMLRSEFDTAKYCDFPSFDLLWIDGDHTYDASMHDYLGGHCLLAEKGVVAFHDVLKNELHEQQGCEVWKTIDEIMADNENPYRIDFITDGTWGGISILKIKQ